MMYKTCPIACALALSICIVLLISGYTMLQNYWISLLSSR